MEKEGDEDVSSNEDVPPSDVSFSLVTVVATEWMFDFLFVSLCRHFKEGNLEHFNELIATFQVVARSQFLKKTVHGDKTTICAFLCRVMHGEMLDVYFDEDESVTPLMSAAKMWASLKSAVADDSLFDNVTVLLLSQAVDVCLKEGRRDSASFVLKWVEENIECPRRLQVKLSEIVAQKETYNPFLMTFSFSRLRDTVQSFLDAFLEKNPSDYLLKAATETVESTYNLQELEDVSSQHNSSTETANGSHKTMKNSHRTKRKLLPTKTTALWTPDSLKKAVVSVKKMTVHDISKLKLDASVNVSDVNKRRKAREKWTAQLDRYLKDGVMRHGVGRWSRILVDFDFGNRTGTMLKDRWRVLLKTDQV